MTIKLTPVINIDNNLNDIINHADKLCQDMKRLNIKDAVLHDGTRYKNDVAKLVQFVATDGCLVIMREHTVSIHMPRLGAPVDGILAETTALTQQMQGSMIGASQPTVSRLLNPR